MERFTILVGRFYKSVTPTNYFFKVPLVGRFMPLVDGIGRFVESPLESELKGITCILMVIWVINLQTELMVDIYSKSLVRAFGKKGDEKCPLFVNKQLF